MTAQAPHPSHSPSPRWTILVHGGAGTIARGVLNADQERAYRAGVGSAAEAGAKILDAGGAALDAVEAAVGVLEDDPLFNAGKGAVFTALGRTELDAALMEGATLKAGAVAGVTRARHPIALARAVMDHSPHVMLMGEQADAFAASRGLEIVSPGYFFTERRWRSLLNFVKAQHLPVPEKPEARSIGDAREGLAHDEGKHGTVGVVALDRHKNVAAGTSTGGITGKRWGRVGDTPIIGAGTFAANSSCAVSATGTGEYFIRLCVARTIAALVEMKGMTLQAAADVVIQKELTALGGQGGIIALAPDGQWAWSFNTSGMYRARWVEGEALLTEIYKD